MENQSSRVLGRYILVGLLVTLIDFGLFLGLLGRVGPIGAKLAAYGLAFVTSTLLSHGWTFRGARFGGPRLRRQRRIIKFLVTALLGAALSVAVILVALPSLDPVWANAICIAVIGPWNFLVNTIWTFRKIQIPSQGEPETRCELTVIVPAYNEEARIITTLQDILRYFDAREEDYEVLVVDDGSSDRTVAVVSELAAGTEGRLRAILLPQNRGKGAAVQMGVINAAGRWILVTDADASTPISEYEKLRAAADDTRVVIGSRWTETSDIQKTQSRLRVAIGRLGNVLIRVCLLDHELKDTQCGFKLFPAAVAQLLFRRQRTWRWGFDMEIIAMAHQFGIEVLEVGVIWRDVGGSRLRPIRDAFRTLTELIAIKLNFWLGRY